MRIIISLLLVVITMLVILPTKAQAEVKTPSATFVAFDGNFQAKAHSQHIKTLERYLQEHNSPMSTSARTFVETAEKNALDWRFVAAISGVESTFGQHIPANSYNGWGFGVYGNNVLRFASWDDAITIISQTLKKKYIDGGATDIYAIGRIYAADPAWASKVQRVMNDISVYERNFTDTRLSISI